MYPVTPKSSPQQPVKKQRTSEENNNGISSTTSKTKQLTSRILEIPTTPPKRRKILPPIPPTPGFSRHKSKEPAFPGKNIKLENDLDPIQFSDLLSPILVYKDQQGDKHNVFQQPEGSKSCYAYSFAMLLTDIIRKGKSLELDDSFDNWFNRAYLLNEENVQKKAKELGVFLEHTKIPNETPMDHIRKEIEKSGFPVLTTIEHPRFSGHAIVVDKVTDTETTIRDPYSGKVFVIPNEKMNKNYDDDFFGRESCLSVAKGDTE